MNRQLIHLGLVLASLTFVTSALLDLSLMPVWLGCGIVALFFNRPTDGR